MTNIREGQNQTKGKQAELQTIHKENSLIVRCDKKKQQYLADFIAKQGKKLSEINIDEFSKQKNVKFIMVVGGGMSAEREVSFMSSNGIVDSLLELGYYVVFVDMGVDIASVLTSLKPDIVFNALHGTYGEDGCLPGLLNILDIPYTGPGVLPSALAFNKYKSYEIFKVNNIKIADFVIVDKEDNINNDPIARPYVIKPFSQGSSVGIELVFPEDDFSFKDYEFKYSDKVIIEQYVSGREIQVAVLNGKAMGALEIKLLQNKRFYDYEVKYTEGFSEHLLPAPLSEEATKRVMALSEKACKIFDCASGIIRAEFIYSEAEDEFYMLELNTHPGMTPLSICPEIVAEKNISYKELVAKILETAK